MKSLVLFAVLLLTSSLAVANGTVVMEEFYSAALGQTEHASVYLPEGYDGIARYPVVYFLHGVGNGIDVAPIPDNYAFTEQVLDALIGANLMEPVIMVRPNGYTGPYAGTMWINTLMYGSWEDYVVNDVIPHMDATFATLPYREDRAIVGHSMGGFGAFRIAFDHPDLFSDLISLSGLVGMDQTAFETWRNYLLFETGHPGTPPYQYIPSPTAWFTSVVYTLSGAFTPNFNNPPFFVDFPLDADGNLVQSVVDAYALQMPIYLVPNYAGSLNGLRIRLDVGTQDEFGLYGPNTAFSEALNDLGLTHEFLTFEGGHQDHLGERFQMAMMDLGQTMCPTACPGQYFTMSSGQWGQDICHGNNMACLRDRFFNVVYPEGMTVGVGNTITFTNSAAVGAALPAGGNPGMLTMDLTDPTSRDLRMNGGTFAGDVITFKLNLDYAAVANFRYLDELVVGEDQGAFSGMSLDGVLGVAESVLGGDMTALPGEETLASLQNLLSMINMDFENGEAAVNPDLLLQRSFGPCLPCSENLSVASLPASSDSPVITTRVTVSGNYPNPFNPSTSIGFDLAENGKVSLRVFNLMGQEVATLLNGPVSAGHHDVVFNASSLPSGMYIYRLEAKGIVQQHKMLLMK